MQSIVHNMWVGDPRRPSASSQAFSGRLSSLELPVLVLAGLAASVFYFSWWTAADLSTSPWLALLLVCAGFFYWSQQLSSWWVYLAARRGREAPDHHAVSNLTVDVFVTVCHESVALVEKSLRAAVAMRRTHTTYLLDDAHDPKLKALAKRLGAGYLTRSGRSDAKAGNINAALSRTTGDLVVIFDVDHVPEVDFLEQSLGHFQDPEIGFVQVMLSFSNASTSWVARAASETGDFFNPAALGMDRLGSATMMGTNAIVRRSALESIGGYRPGLAEDLATSIALHAAGWRSAYVAEPLAPGLSPPDLRAWFTQQMKWARGVFEVLLTQYPVLFLRLRPAQRFCYLLRMTYYWSGLVIAIHLLATLVALLGGGRFLQADFQAYALHAAPLLAADLFIRRAAFLKFRHRSVDRAFVWRAGALIYSTWPIYCLAWTLSILRWPLRFRATPKDTRPLPIPFLLPQWGTATLLIFLAVSASSTSWNGFVLSMIAVAQAVPQLIVLMAFLAERNGSQDLSLGVSAPLSRQF